MKALPIFTSAQDDNPKSLISYSTLITFFACGRPKVRFAANMKHSRGVRVPNRASYCMTYPI